MNKKLDNEQKARLEELERRTKDDHEALKRMTAEVTKAHIERDDTKKKYDRDMALLHDYVDKIEKLYFLCMFDNVDPGLSKILFNRPPTIRYKYRTLDEAKKHFKENVKMVEV